VQSKTMLVVSDPPHEVIVKEEAAAEALGLPVDHTLLKVGFGAPEVLGATDPERAADLAISLKAADVRVQMRDGSGLARIPWPTIVAAFELDRDALRARVEDGAVVEIPYDEPVVAVSCEPPVDFVPPADWSGPNPAGTSLSGAAAADALEWVPHVDLYFQRDGRLRRISIDGELIVPLVAECEGRFTRLTLDRRLEGVRPRRRFVAGDVGFNPDQRKRYAFGTLLLRHALESIDPELRDLTQYELGSRLAYLLGRGPAG
jgi:hypothetical protein